MQLNADRARCRGAIYDFNILNIKLMHENSAVDVRTEPRQDLEP